MSSARPRMREPGSASTFVQPRPSFSLDLRSASTFVKPRPSMATEHRTVVFRADASAALGGGHLVRCLALATAFAEAGWHVGFAVNGGALSVVPALAEAVADVLVVNGDDDEVPALAERWPDGATLLIVDHYGRGAAFERRCRPWAAATPVIDDLAEPGHEDMLSRPIGNDAGAHGPASSPPPCKNGTA